MTSTASVAAGSKTEGLLCPACRVDLVMSDRQGIEIDYCPKCRGVWLDRGELDKIIERNASYEAQGAQRQPDQPRQDRPYPSRDRYDGDHGSGHGSGHGGYGQGRRHGSFLERLFD